MKEKMKLIQRNCLIFAIIGFVLIIIGIGFITNSSSSGGSWSGGWYSNIKKQRETRTTNRSNMYCYWFGSTCVRYHIL